MALHFMLRVSFVFSLQFLCLWARVLQQQSENSLCSALVSPQGSYQCDEFVVRTDDGFLLGVQRMSAGANAGKKKIPVFLMHGILSGGDTWLLNPPTQSLGFILADAGYDVWIGNFRTTGFCKGHAFYTPRDWGYWNWSVDELAEKDLVAMVEFAYRTTNARLHYIGFSQGTQAALAALSQGMLVDRLDKIVMMAPIAYVKHTTTPLGIIAGKLQLDQVFSRRLRFFSLNTKTKSGREYVDILCAATNMRCFNGWATAFTGPNCCINDSRRAFYDTFETQDTSTKNLQHLGQGAFRHGTFAKFNYGAIENMRRYNSMQPPAYDLSKVPTSKMLLIYGKNDALSDVTDVVELMKELPLGFKALFIPDYAHIDFIVGYNAYMKVYKDIISFIEQ